MQNIVGICIYVVVVCILGYFALKGMNRLMKMSDRREAPPDAYIKRGYDPDEQQRRRIEENR